MTIDELLKDKEFADAVDAAESEEELIKVFRAKGIELDESTIHTLMTEEGELNEEALDNVAGGRLLMPNPIMPIFPAQNPFLKWLKNKLKR